MGCPIGPSPGIHFTSFWNPADHSPSPKALDLVSAHPCHAHSTAPRGIIVLRLLEELGLYFLKEKHSKHHRSIARPIQVGGDEAAICTALISQVFYKELILLDNKLLIFEKWKRG